MVITLIQEAWARCLLRGIKWYIKAIVKKKKYEGRKNLYVQNHKIVFICHGELRGSLLITTAI